MKILQIDNNTNKKNSKNQTFGYFYKFDLNNSYDRELKEKLIKNGGKTFMTKCLGWERVKKVFDENTDLYMPPKEFENKYRDAYWLHYKELHKICKKWLKSAKPVSKEIESEILNTISNL